MSQKTIATRIEQAIKLEDAGQRIFKLKQIEDDIEQEQKKIRIAKGDVGSGVTIVACVLAIAFGCFVAAMGPAFLPGLLMFGVGCFSAWAIATPTIMKQKAAFENANDGKEKKLASQKAEITSAINKTLYTQLNSVGCSIVCSDLFEKYPDVQMKFGKVAQRRIVAEAHTAANKPQVCDVTT